MENANASPPSRRWTTYRWARKNPIVTATSQIAENSVALRAASGTTAVTWMINPARAIPAM